MAGRVFISYRRADSQVHAQLVLREVERAFGRNSAFMDLDLKAGHKFPEMLERALGSCKAMVAVIGPAYLSITEKFKDGHGLERERRRLDNPRDWVRLELRRALERGIPVIPVLVGGADLPAPEALPEDIRALVEHQGRTIGTNPISDMAALVHDLRPHVGAWPVWVTPAAAGMAAALALVGLYQLGFPLLMGGLLSGQAEEMRAPSARSVEAAAAEAGRRVAAEKAQREEQQRLAALAEQKRMADAAEAKRRAEEAERQRLAALQEERKRVEAEAETRRKAAAEKEQREEQQRLAALAEQKRMADAAEAKPRAEEAERHRLAALQEERNRFEAEAETRRKAAAEKEQRDKEQELPRRLSGAELARKAVDESRANGNSKSKTAEVAAETDAHRIIAPPTSFGGNRTYISVLASSRSHIDALTTFADLQQKYPGVLQNRHPNVQEANIPEKGVFHRLMAGPAGSREDADALCTQLKAAGHASCWVTLLKPDQRAEAEAQRKADAAEAGASRRAEEAERQRLAALQAMGEPPPSNLPSSVPRAAPAVIDVQKELARVGCDPGSLDGKWGTKARAALAQFARRAKVAFETDEPTQAVLDALMAKKDRVCPLVCDGDQVFSNGRCVDKPKPRPAVAEQAPQKPKLSGGTGKPCGWGNNPPLGVSTGWTGSKGC